MRSELNYLRIVGIKSIADRTLKETQCLGDGQRKPRRNG